MIEIDRREIQDNERGEKGKGKGEIEEIHPQSNVSACSAT